MITILGPTASGKTRLAANLASRLNGEVISADSRQVFRGMNIGTGKDYEDFIVEGKPIRYHLIDIDEPGAEYNIFRYQQDFLKAYDDVTGRGKIPILCGGSGMYLEAVLKGYKLPRVKPDKEFLSLLDAKSNEELEEMLRSQKTMHNITDLEDRPRMIVALSIAHQSGLDNPDNAGAVFPEIKSLTIGINYPRGLLKKRITERLGKRLEQGMMAEIEHLISLGVKPDSLMRYGLEYKFGTQFITGQISHEEMFYALNKAIHQFAKRQMTWFRRMERNKIKINWVDGRIPLTEMVEQVIALYQPTQEGPFS
jgi:tRNA dimethylallyltransferase